MATLLRVLCPFFVACGVIHRSRTKFANSYLTNLYFKDSTTGGMTNLEKEDVQCLHPVSSADSKQSGRDSIKICESNAFDVPGIYLTWARVAHSADTLNGNATCTSIRLVALPNVVTLVRRTVVAVSYTHLTLPTICSV